jgi:hypothetical protein
VCVVLGRRVIAPARVTSDMRCTPPTRASFMLAGRADAFRVPERWLKLCLATSASRMGRISAATSAERPRPRLHPVFRRRARRRLRSTFPTDARYTEVIG